MIAQIATTPQRGAVKDTPDELVGRLSCARGGRPDSSLHRRVFAAGGGAKRVPFAAGFLCVREHLFLYSQVATTESEQTVLSLIHI